MSLSKGIVVLVWDGIVNFAKAKKAGLIFALIRLGFGSFSCYVDGNFDANAEKAAAAGLKVATYWRSYAKTVGSAKVEAAGCLGILNDRTSHGKTLLLPVYVEADSDLIAKAFCAELQAAGVTAVPLVRGSDTVVDGATVGTAIADFKSKSKKTAAKQPEAAPVSD